MGIAILLIAVSVGAIALYAHYNSRDAVIRRMLRKSFKTTTGAFDERASGKLVGTLRYLAPPLHAPLSGRVCAYYEVLVEEYRSSGKSGSWHKLVSEADGRDFLLEDDDGTARVVLRHAQVAVVKDAHFKSGTFNDAADHLEAFLGRHGLSSKGWVFNKRLRYREGVLEEGETVAVCGRGIREPDPDPRAASGYRDSATRLVLSGVAEAPLYVSDDPRTLG